MESIYRLARLLLRSQRAGQKQVARLGHEPDETAPFRQEHDSFGPLPSGRATRPKTRIVRPLPNTAPFHKASSRWYRAGTRPIETVSLQGRRSSPAAAHFPREPPYPVPENAERGAFLLRRRQLRYGLSDATPDGPWNRPLLRLPNIPLLRHGSEIGLRYRDLPGKEGRHGLKGAGLALPDAGLSDANPDGTYSQLRCTRRYPAGTEPLVIAAFRPPSALPEPP